MSNTSVLLETAALITDALRRLEGLEFDDHDSPEYWDHRLAIRGLRSAGGRVKAMIIESSEAKNKKS